MNIVRLCIAILLVCVAVSRVDGQEKPSITQLFDALRNEATTDEAAQQFIQFELADEHAKQFLASRLPDLITPEPEFAHARPWDNYIRLAGAFQITEAIPALAQRLTSMYTRTFSGGLTSGLMLEPFPAGRALAEIGEPAVPTLARILREGNGKERTVAFRALSLIATPSAVKYREQHLDFEPDPGLKDDMERTLKAEKAEKEPKRFVVETPIQTLLQQLEADQTADDAGKQLLTATLNTDIQLYFTYRLPLLIAADPKQRPHVWYNAVQLAGKFRISEAVEALGQSVDVVIGLPEGTANVRSDGLDTVPAVNALVEIGDPSVPPLVRILQSGAREQRLVAARALHEIGSQPAVAALRDRLRLETDTEIIQFLEENSGNKPLR